MPSATVEHAVDEPSAHHAGHEGCVAPPLNNASENTAEHSATAEAPLDHPQGGKAQPQGKPSKAQGQGKAPAQAPNPTPLALSAPLMADSRQTKVMLCGYEFEGISISGQETSIIVPKAKVTFDIGRCPQRACFQPTVLLSHTHLDHIGGLAFHVCTRRMLELPSSRVVCPVGAGSKVRRVVDVAREVQNSPPIDFEVVELESNADMSIDIPSTEFIVKSFPTCHPIESQGYVLYSKREKLLPELQGLKGAEIKKRKDAGEKVTQSILVPEIAFTGDTTSAFLDGDSPVLADALRAKVLIMEMTYLGIDYTPEQARDRGHMHVRDFVDREDMFKNEAIMLIHFSPRYKRSEILAQLEAALPPKLAARCTPLLNGIE